MASPLSILADSMKNFTIVHIKYPKSWVKYVEAKNKLLLLLLLLLFVFKM